MRCNAVAQGLGDLGIPEAVFAGDGAPLGVIDCPQSPANCTWGEDGSTLFITARTAVYATHIDAIGVAPYLR